MKSRLIVDEAANIDSKKETNGSVASLIFQEEIMVSHFKFPFFKLPFASIVLIAHASAQSLPNLFPLPNGSGVVQTYNVNNAPISLKGAFFQSLGTNGRSCSSCHVPTEGWSVSAAEIQLRFLLTLGNDPIFRTNDGSNCDHDIDTSTVQGRRRAYSLLTERGLIRIAIAPPAGAEFEVVSVRNPYGCNETQS